MYPYKDLLDSESIIFTDKQRLTQILNNLLSNAFKFTSKGEINFGYRKAENNLEFFVKDTGLGIPESMYQAVFERFRQAENPEFQPNHGTGLGLSISQKLVELLGGKIYLESMEEKGTTFYFTVPYIKPPQEVEQAIDQQTLVSPGFKHTILIAEDEEINLLYLNEILNHPSVITIHARNGMEAIELCKKHVEVDIVLMDVKMPKMNGLDATRKIREFRPELPIIIQSAYAMQQDKERAFLSGCTDFLVKPINKGQLIKMLNKYLDTDLFT